MHFMHQWLDFSLRKVEARKKPVVKGLCIELWVGVIFLVSCGFSVVGGSLVADPPTVILAGMVGMGMLACEFSMPERRRRRRPPMPIVTGPSRN
jgi:hypothetical protein